MLYAEGFVQTVSTTILRHAIPRGGNWGFPANMSPDRGTLDLAKQRLNRSPTTPGLPEWVSPGRSLRIAQDKVGQHVPPLCASSLPNQPRSPRSPPDCSPIESSDAGVRRLTPFRSGSRCQCQQLPLGITTRGTPSGFSRAVASTSEGYSNCHWETRKPDWWFAC